MKRLIKNFLRPNSQFELGNNLFLIGVFFLPSALPLSAIFLIISLAISLKERKLFLLKDVYNYLLFIAIGLILFSTINISLFNVPSALLKYDISLIWINLINWLPTFLYFWGFQNYLVTNKQRIIFAKYLIAGSLPVILSFLFQKFFSFYGPYKTLFGLIIWFQKPIINKGDSIAGLFSNPNYAASWIVLVLPFAAMLLKKENLSILKKSIVFLFYLLFIYVILLTGSRNGFLGIIITALCFYSYKRILKFLIFLFSCFLINNLLGFLIKEDSQFVKIYDPTHLINKLSDLNTYIPRLEIWNSTLLRILERPFLGWGGSTFSFLNRQNDPSFLLPNNMIDAQHAHNIALELAHNFGIPLSIILITFISLILFRSWIYLFRENSNTHFSIEKAFFVSASIAFLSHFSDLTLYDGKLNILIGILLASLKCIIDQKNSYSSTKKAS